jgi:hypothetical protein
MPMKHFTLIEPLEDRIAPATILNPYTVTYQDLNTAANGSQVIGETVVVKISHPLFTSPAAAAKILLFTDINGSSIKESFTGNGTGEFLNAIDLLGRHDAQDMNISVKVIQQQGVGNGQVNVGDIAAANFSVADQVSQNIDLGSIYIQGNLGEITAGDNLSTPAIKSLKVLSMDTGSSGGSQVESQILGPIVNMDVSGNFNTLMNIIGYRFGSIGKLTIGGALAGDSAGDSGTGVIQFTGQITSATIGNITGTAGTSTGELVGVSANPSRIGSLHVLGSITGGSGQDSGRVFAEASIGKLTVGGSIVGGAGQDSGEVAGPLKTVNISGGLTGGSGISSGTILSEAFTSTGAAVSLAMGTLTIGGDVTGGTAGVAAASSTASATPGDSGIISAASARSIHIGGSLIGGTAGTHVNSSGTQDQTADTSGAILVNSVESLTIGGSITGGTGPNSGIITGQGGLTTMKYGTIVVNGDVAGGAGAISGAILINGLLGGTISNLNIAGSVTGSSGTQSGEVFAKTSLGTLIIGGNVTGGTADNTGEIFSGGNLTNATIKGNLTGNSSINSATAVVASGYIQAGHVGTMEIIGNVTAGSNSGGEIANSGAIRSAGDISSLTIDGTVTGTSKNPVIISAAQGAGTTAKSKTDLAINSLTIVKAVDYLDVLAGYSPTVSNTANTDPAGAPLGTPVDGSAQINNITFESTLSASNVVAGAEPDSNGHFGTTGNKAIPISLAASTVKSSIATIIVSGQATGDSTSTDSFGFVAESLPNVSVNGSSNLAGDNLKSGVPVVVPNSTNLFMLEVPAPS